MQTKDKTPSIEGFDACENAGAQGGNKGDGGSDTKNDSPEASMTCVGSANEVPSSEGLIPAAAPSFEKPPNEGLELTCSTTSTSLACPPKNSGASIGADRGEGSEWAAAA